MANFEFQPDMEVKKLPDWNEQIENQRTLCYNKCKEEIKKLCKMRDLKVEDSGWYEDIQKAWKSWLSQIALKLSDAFWLWLSPNVHIPTLDVTLGWAIKLQYSTSDSQKVTIIMNETTARITTQDFEKDHPNIDRWSATRQVVKLKNQNFRNGDEMKEYIYWYADRLKEKAIAHMSSVDGDDLEILRRRLEEAYNQ